MQINLPAGFTRLIDLSSAAYDLTVWVQADTDIDGIFEAICDDTGERLTVMGWMFDLA